MSALVLKAASKADIILLLIDWAVTSTARAF